MRYYLDTEFYERPGAIDLISIGIVAEDGSEFYAENAEFDWSFANARSLVAANGSLGCLDTPRWLEANVKPHLTYDHQRRGRHIQEDRVSVSPGWIKQKLLAFFQEDDKPEFWGWYCDYDWVVFCWIFGRMIDLPPTFPKFCRDLRQAIDGTGVRAKDVKLDGDAHNALNDARWNRRVHEAILKAST